MTDFEAQYKRQADRAHDLANQCQVLMNENYLLEISNKELVEALEAMVLNSNHGYRACYKKAVSAIAAARSQS